MSDLLRKQFATLWDQTLSQLEGAASAQPTETLRAEEREFSTSATLVAPESASPPSSATVRLPRLSLEYPPELEGPAAGLPSGEGERDVRVSKVLGEGGMGLVLLGTQHSLGREVAIKLVRPASRSAQAVSALLHEARITGGLEHPNIVPVHSLALDTAGSPLMVMKRIEGISWRDLLAGPPEAAPARFAARGADRLGLHLEVLVQVCNALEYAHDRGVVHRDLKPDNVMLGPYGEVYLVDWGIALRVPARDEDSPHVVGTPAYMAPEMVTGRGSLVDARTDVFLLGATLHELLIGAPRFTGGTLSQVLLSAYLCEPVAYPAEAPAELAALAESATAREPAARPASVRDFRLRVEDFLRHRASHALCASAEASLAAAEHREGGAASPEHYRRLSEARFGFLQALREWSDNKVAQQGLEHTLGLMLERELGARNAVAARSLLAELEVPAPAWVAKVEALEAELEAERRKVAQASEREREMDLSSTSRARTAVFGLFGVLTTGLAMTLLLRERRAGVEPRMSDIVQMDLAVGTLAVLLFAFNWRRLTTTVASRRLSWMMLLSVLGTLGSDGLSYLQGASPRQAVARSLSVLGGSFTCTAAMGTPALGYLAVLTWSGAVLSALRPGHSSTIMFCTMVLLLGGSLFLVRTGRLQAR